MAHTVVVSLVDDLDGNQATETVEFALDGHTYEIDLSSTNASTLRETLARYTTAARTAGGTPKSTRGPVSAAARVAVRRKPPHPIREWARAQGIQLTDHDRTQPAVIDIPHPRTTRPSQET